MIVGASVALALGGATVALVIIPMLKVYETVRETIEYSRKKGRES